MGAKPSVHTTKGRTCGHQTCGHCCGEMGGGAYIVAQSHNHLACKLLERLDVPAAGVGLNLAVDEKLQRRISAQRRQAHGASTTAEAHEGVGGRAIESSKARNGCAGARQPGSLAARQGTDLQARGAVLAAYPLTSLLAQRSACTVQSTCATDKGPLPLCFSASSAHAGAIRLQCPHHGATPGGVQRQRRGRRRVARRVRVDNTRPLRPGPATQQDTLRHRQPTVELDEKRLVRLSHNVKGFLQRRALGR